MLQCASCVSCQSLIDLEVNSNTSLVFTKETINLKIFFLQGKLLEPFQLVCQQSSWSWTRTVVSHPNCHSVPKARGKFTEDFFFHSIERLKEWKLFALPWIWPWLKTAIFDPHRLHHLRIPIAWHKKGSWADFPSNQFLQDSRWGLTMSSRPTSPRLFT